MGNFLTGLLSGGVSQAGKNKDGKLKGLFKRKKKPGPSGSGETPYEGSIPSFKRGGKVKRTGFAKVHKGEKVLTAKQAKRPKKHGRGRRSKKR